MHLNLLIFLTQGFTVQYAIAHPIAVMHQRAVHIYPDGDVYGRYKKHKKTSKQTNKTKAFTLQSDPTIKVNTGF